MPKPVAVILNDVHYDLPNLLLADTVTRLAIKKANDLDVQLVVAGDLHNTKANLRAECVNAMIETFSLARTTTHIMIGNHDRINEKSLSHSLSFLRRKNINLIETTASTNNFHYIAYHHDPDELRTYLKTISKGSTLIMHQGLTGSNSGDYIQDKSAITKQDVAGFRVISGHYHQRQDIELPDGGLWTYTGNPYSLNFGEANDPAKGFHILIDDGSLEFVPTNLRKHVIYDVSIADMPWCVTAGVMKGRNDIVWIKIRGTKEELATCSKQHVAKNMMLGDHPFKLDLIPTDTETKAPEQTPKNNTELLDTLIDSINTADSVKTRLKQAWRDLSE